MDRGYSWESLQHLGSDQPRIERRSIRAFVDTVRLAPGGHPDAKGAIGMIQRRFTIRTNLLPDQARSRLMAAIAPEPVSILERDPRPFRGSMTGPAFRIIRVSRGRNSFRPVVQGSIEPDGGGSRVAGTMGLHPVVLIFLGFLLLVPGGLLLSTIVSGITTGRWDRTAVLVGAVPLVFVAIAAMAFVTESRRTLADLTAAVTGGRSP